VCIGVPADRERAVTLSHISVVEPPVAPGGITVAEWSSSEGNMKHSAIGLALLGLTSTAFAQEPGAPAPLAEKSTAKNSLYAELGGNSGWYSINYERFIMPDAAIRVGVSYMSVTASAGTGMNSSSANATWATVPIMFNYLGLRAGSHALELGGGVNMMYFSGSAATFDATAMSSGVVPVGAATIGYRFSNPDGGFVFRAGYTPLIFLTTEQKDIFHWGGMSFGYRF
jgi:hypothetical protein